MKTEIIKTDSLKSEGSKIQRAAEIIASGGLVGFPTETVYGIAACVADSSLRKLDSVKSRSGNKHYTLHIATKGEVHKYVPSLSLKEKKLVQNGWPGPITIVFALGEKEMHTQKERMDSQVLKHLYPQNTIGIRCPDNKIASMLLSKVNCPVVAPSANLTGREPAVDAHKVATFFSGKIDVILDGGTCKYRKSSTVVKVNQGKLEILRDGVLSRKELIALSIVQILFVCTGNTCRSPMAEGLFKKYLSKKLNCKVDELCDMGYKVVSAGIMNTSGLPASKASISVCAGLGVDISRHRSRALTKELISESDLVFGMSAEHIQQAKELCPEETEKCVLLAEDENILDPVGQSEEVYKFCANAIVKAITKRIKEIKL